MGPGWIHIGESPLDREVFSVIVRISEIIYFEMAAGLRQEFFADVQSLPERTQTPTETHASGIDHHARFKVWDFRQPEIINDDTAKAQVDRTNFDLPV